MGLENKVHDVLMNFPVLKKVVKRVYQGANVVVFRPKKSDGNIKRVTPDDEYEYLFGYYDKSPWDVSGRYLLCLRVKDASHETAPKTIAEIVLIDTEDNNSIKVIAKTHTWNVQQGCMAGWLGPDFNKKIFYNDCRHGKYRGVILNIETGKEKILDRPVYTVSNDGKVALSLDFSRLHRLRPGYGYSNLNDKTIGRNVPDGPCVWRIDIKTGKGEPILSYKTLYDFEHRKDMEDAEHKVNHLMLSPNGKRFIVIHRWLKGGKKTSRLLTCDIDGNDLYDLSDEDMVSHCYWKNDKEILAYCKHGGENGYYLFKDQTESYERKWGFLTSDGHPSYSPNGKLVVTDTYPNRKRICTLRVLSDTVSTIVAKVYAPFKYDNNTRCDLHPRWNRDGEKICFDGCFEGKREVYVVDVSNTIDNNKQIGAQIAQLGPKKVLFVLNSCKNKGPTKVLINIIKNIDQSKFNPILLTLVEENNESCIGEILPYVSKKYFCKTLKKDIIFGRLEDLENIVNDINPNVIHSTGVFPDYAISKFANRKQVITMHNYAPFDYMAKFGNIKGRILINLQYAAARRVAKVVACSKSLSKLYQNDSFNFDYIRNGINTKQFSTCDNKSVVRKKLKIDNNKYIFIFTGQFVSGKNIDFALEGFTSAFCGDESVEFILLGDGPELNRLMKKYKTHNNIRFLGRKTNVGEYLCASDAYVSASKSEGMPNGVLEAIASGLPVLLSDIPQHREILEVGEKCGYSFSLDNKDELCKEMKRIQSDNLKTLSKNARATAEKFFDSAKMSKEYQRIYQEIANNA